MEGRIAARIGCVTLQKSRMQRFRGPAKPPNVECLRAFKL